MNLHRKVARIVKEFFDQDRSKIDQLYIAKHLDVSRTSQKVALADQARIRSLPISRDDYSGVKSENLGVKLATVR